MKWTCGRAQVQLLARQTGNFLYPPSCQCDDFVHTTGPKKLDGRWLNSSSNFAAAVAEYLI